MATVTEVQKGVRAASTEKTGAWAAFVGAVKQSRLPWLFILPSTLVMAVVTLYPQALQVYMSFTNFDNRHFNPENSPDWVGLQNFEKILNNSIPISNYSFPRLLAFNIIWAISNVAFHVVIGVGVAMLLNAKGLWLRRLYRAIFVLAWATPGYISALVWRSAFNQNYGAINLLIGKFNEWFGLHISTSTRWLVDEVPPIDLPIFSILPYAFYAVFIANLWLGWPFMMIVATGALQSIPKELYEAADVDGATKWRQFWSITVPLIRPAMVPAIMLGMIWTFNGFNVIYFITGGGPRRQTEILVTQAYNLLQETSIPGRYGMAAAFSLVVFVILLFITLINNRITKATESYDEA
ncbi:MAG: sugar ABC transporter permease [Chloroflexi bacterium]|nr:sugar ABC transporter permease [Chloroflexota bacterium]